MSSPIFTSEELRVVAMNNSSLRGKSVARRRLIWRWITWFLWSIFLPFVGLLTVLVGISALLVITYYGQEKSYITAQNWVQQKMDPIKNVSTTDSSSLVNPLSDRTSNSSMIPLTDEATPDLQLDRNLTIKTKPVVSDNK